MSVALIFGISSAFAYAAAIPGDPGGVSPPWTTPTGIEAAVEDASSFSRAATDSSAAAYLPLGDLGRPEAAEVLTAVFGEVLVQPTSIYDELDVSAFRSDYVAVVPTGQNEEVPGNAALLTSTLPLRAENEQGANSVVDLDLARQDGELKVANPLVDLDIPSALGDGIGVPGTGITVDLVGAPANREPSSLEGGAAFYPNVAPDSDLTIVPTPSGFETFTQLRSEEAPTIQTFELDLPVGAELREDGQGGALIRMEGETLMAVHAPSAIDATGTDVPVDLEVTADSITLNASPPLAAIYPILVDPLFESYLWVPNSTAAGLSDWKEASNSPLFKNAWLSNWNSQLYIGLGLSSGTGAVAPGAQSNWNYYVPRYFTDKANPTINERPTSYIRSAQLAQVKFAIDEAAPYKPWPLLIAGIWNEKVENWTSFAQWSGDGGQILNPPASVPLPNPNEVVEAKNIGVALMTGGSQSYPRRAIVGQATVELSDKDTPDVGSLGLPSQWVNTVSSAPISYSAGDSGLGVYSVELKQPAAVGGSSVVKTSTGCIGTVSSPCPRTVNSNEKALSYDPQTMPQGENYVRVAVLDPIGHRSDSLTVKESKVKVDHSKPKLSFSGSLTEQSSLGTGQAKYTLKYAATDGDEAPAEALSSFGGTGTAPGKTELPIGVAVEANGNVLVVDRANKRVSRFDKDGNYLNQFGTPGTALGQINDPTGITVSPAGFIWIAEMASQRVQMFWPNGQLAGAIVCGCFSQPYAIAAGPNGAIWISDIGVDKLFKYNESGTLLAVAHGRAADPNGTATDMTNVTGLAVDASGGVWAAEYIMNKLIKFDVNGNYVAQIAPPVGSGDGQVVNPGFVTIAPSGNLMVVDYNNSRLQEFKPDGTFMRKFGAYGSGLGQMNAPQGPAFGPNGVLYVPDYLNHRVNRWAHADLDPQSGVVKAEIKVDGQAVKTDTQSCAKTCPLSKEWTLDADDYAIGQHTVEVIATDGVSLATPKALAIETHGDLKDPTIALSGSMTEQASLGTTRPSYTIKVNATDPGATNERKSGVASVKVKVDGADVESLAPGCPAGGCALATEWTLSSPSYSAGSHNVEVIATDAAGRTSIKPLTINIAKDTTPPTITAANAFYNAPEGWIEQKSYGVNATGKDEAGYGVTSMTLKIDGDVVRSSSQGCPAGGCSLQMGLSQPIDMAGYDGGAHDAELRVVDGAGNSARKVWTINVDPAGQVSTEEAEQTIEAVESTSSAVMIGLAGSQEEIEGMVEGLEFTVAEGGGLEGSGTAAPVELSTGEEPALTVETLDPAFLDSRCTAEPSTEMPGLELTGEEEEQLDPMVGGCQGGGPLEKEDPLIPVEIVPGVIGSGAGETDLTDSDQAAVTPNLRAHTDLITRPLFEGAMSFALIRDVEGPESYSWDVKLDEGQELKQLNDQQAVVYFDGTHEAFTITAVPAHDATGADVPTSLTVTGTNAINLTVHHQAGESNGKPFVYPVVAGAGWQGGVQTYQVQFLVPPQVTEEEEETGEYSFLNSRVQIYAFGPPVPEAKLSVDELQPNEPNEPLRKKFKFTYCHPNNYPGVPDGHTDFYPGDFSPRPGQNLPKVISECWREDFNGVRFGVTVHGRVHMVYQKSVWLKDKEWDCDKWGPEQPIELDCQARYLELPKGPLGKVKGPIRLAQYNRWPPLKGEWSAEYAATCLILGGELYPNPRKAFDKPIERPIIFLHRALLKHNPCPWKEMWDDGPGPG